MKAIHKYKMPMLEESETEMPAGAEVIRAEMSEGWICCWAIVSTEAVMVKKKFRLYKTGQEITADTGKLKYIGIANIHVGMDLGMHVFEVMS